MPYAVTIRLSLENNKIVFDKNNRPSTYRFVIDDDEHEENVRIELSIARVFHKIFNFIREQPDVFEKHEFEFLGEMLSRIAFGKVSTDGRRQSLDETFGNVQTDKKNRCRILLNFDAKSGMADLPWEYLMFKFMGGGPQYLSASSYSQFQMARYYPGFVSLPYKPAKKIFVILVMSLDPNKDAKPAINSLQAEREEFTGMFSYLETIYQEKIKYEIVEDCCIEELGARIAKVVNAWVDECKYEPAYIIHYAGHSHFDRKTQSGMIVMKELVNSRVPAWIQDAVFSSAFSTGRLKVRKPSAIFFQSCDSAKIGVTNDMLNGVAYDCLKEGINAVVGMQNEINVTRSCAFYHMLYSSLLEGEDIVESVTRGRDLLGNAILDIRDRELQPNGSSYKNNSFGSPVLFLAGEPLRLIESQEELEEKLPITNHINTEIYKPYVMDDRSRR